MLEGRDITVVWVPAHLTAEMAEARGVSEEDRLGNQRADELAKEAAGMHPLQPGRDAQVERADALARGVVDVLVGIFSAMDKEGLLPRRKRKCAFRVQAMPHLQPRR